ADPRTAARRPARPRHLRLAGAFESACSGCRSRDRVQGWVSPGRKETMPRFIRRALVLGALILTVMVGAVRAVEPPTLSQLEKEIAALRAEVEALRTQAGPDAQRLTELERQLQVLAQEIETLKLGEAAATADRSTHGMGPAASKIYRSGNGLAIGGYGEVVYRSFAGRLEDGSRSPNTD